MMTNQSLTKNYFIASIVVHILVVLAVGYMIKRDAISNKNFVIFGAHSRYTTKALYKSSAVPFTGTPSKGKSGKKGNGKKRAIAPSNKSKKIKAAPNNKKTVQKAVPKKAKAPAKGKGKPQGLRKVAANLQMPSPTAMVEDPIKQAVTKKKKPLKKIKAKVQPMPQPEEIEEPAQKELPLSEAEAAAELEAKLEEEKLLETATQTNPTADDAAAGEESGEDDGDTIHVGVVDSTDPVTRYHQRIISQEFNRLWQPPVGVRKGTECTVRITIGKNGVITAIDFIKRSQVPIYDLSILRLKLAKPELPPTLYGKHMIVVFHQ